MEEGKDKEARGIRLCGVRLGTEKMKDYLITLLAWIFTVIIFIIISPAFFIEKMDRRIQNNEAT